MSSYPMATMGRFWPRSLFGRNLLLLCALAVFVEISSIAVFAYMQRPRAIELGTLIASQLNTLNKVLSATPPDQQSYYVDQIEKGGQFAVLTEVAPERERSPRGMLVELFNKSIRQTLDPDIPIRWRRGSHPQLIVGMNIGGGRYWIASSISPQLQPRFLVSATILSGIMALTALLVAMLIQRRINRPLKDIAEAARKIGGGGQPEKLPLYDTRELASVATQFNAMFDSLDVMDSTRATMLAGISHDIRTPLTKLRLTLAMGCADSDSCIRYIDQIDSIVGQFLDFGRSGHDEKLVAGDLNALIRRLTELFEDRGHRFALKLSALPDFAYRPTAMARILSNLMDNAVKYGRHGLEVTTRYADGAICVSVSDNGPGLPKDHDPAALLKPFVRADLGRSQTSGTGLGLAIVDRLVRLHGGTFTLRNRTGGGAEAIITLKAAPSP